MNTPLKIILTVLPAMMLFASCAMIDSNNEAEEPGRRTETTGDVLVLEEGEQAALPTFSATLTFVEKTQDSRCPADVICVWQGEAKILLSLARSGQAPVSFEITGFAGPNGYEDGSPSPATYNAFGLRFSLLRLDPYPLADVEQTDPVTATIRVEAL